MNNKYDNGRQPRDIIDRLLEKVVINTDGCWVFICGYYSKWGYAKITTGSARDGTSKNRYVHRVSYEAFIGKIPDKMPLDHLCNNTKCINPDHLEIVTTAENNFRKRKSSCGVCGNDFELRYNRQICLYCQRKRIREYMRIRNNIDPVKYRI